MLLNFDTHYLGGVDPLGAILVGLNSHNRGILIVPGDGGAGAGLFIEVGHKNPSVVHFDRDCHDALAVVDDLVDDPFYCCRFHCPGAAVTRCRRCFNCCCLVLCGEAHHLPGDWFSCWRCRPTSSEPLNSYPGGEQSRNQNTRLTSCWSGRSLPHPCSGSWGWWWPVFSLLPWTSTHNHNHRGSCTGKLDLLEKLSFRWCRIYTVAASSKWLFNYYTAKIY